MTVDDLLFLKRQHARIKKALADFYCAPLSMASVQPILDLAVELNPDLARKVEPSAASVGIEMPHGPTVREVLDSLPAGSAVVNSCEASYKRNDK